MDYKTMEAGESYGGTQAQPTPGLQATESTALQRVPAEDKFWSTGICSCTCMQCICGYCCFCCQAARLGNRMNESCGLCVACFFLNGLRSRFRTLYGIKGSVCNDGYMSLFCAPCVLWQMDRELDKLGV